MIENNDLDELIPIELEANVARTIGLQVMYIMKAGSYTHDQAVKVGRLMVLDCFLMVGMYADDAFVTEEWGRASLEADRQRVLDQADFIGGHLINFLKNEYNLIDEVRR